MSVQKETGSSRDNTFKVTFKDSGKSYIMKPADAICGGCLGLYDDAVCRSLPPCGDYVFLKELDSD